MDVMGWVAAALVVCKPDLQGAADDQPRNAHVHIGIYWLESRRRKLAKTCSGQSK